MLGMSLSGQVALVTGASRGIGQGIAMRLARDGAAVAVNYRQRESEAAAVVAAIAAAGGRAVAVQADIGDAAQVRQMADRIASSLGTVGILVNNAAVFRRGDLADFDFTQMEGMRRVNVDGLVHVTRAFVEPMKKLGSGRIVNITSIAAHGTSLAGTTFYAATKAAIGALTRRFAMELGPYGITVNAVAPGYVLTEMAVQDRSPAEVEELTRGVAALAMVRRVGKPEDIAQAVAFLVDPRSGFVTAQTLTIDGGRTDYIAHP
jgi:3-oxoacyl-[acyl-carrier protein] reductase